MPVRLQARQHIDIRTCYVDVTRGKPINSGDVEWCGAGFDGARFTACVPGYVKRDNSRSVKCRG